MREYPHDACPVWQDPRGGVRTSKHVDILGNFDVTADILSVATGGGDLEDRVDSDILGIAAEASARLRTALGER